MRPEQIAARIEEFVSNCECPALLERGVAPIQLASGQFRLDVTPKGAWLEVWDRSRVWSRRILRIGDSKRNSMQLEAFRFGKSNLPVSIVDAADLRSAPAVEKTRRSEFAESFRLFLNRHFASWRGEAFRSEAKLEHSFSPIYPTALLTKGNQAVAAIASPMRDTSFHCLTFALIWLDWVRRHHGDLAARRLLLYLPEGHHQSVVLLARHLNPAKLDLDIWLYTEDGEEYPLDPADGGNIESTLAPRYSKLAGPAWWIQFLSKFEDVDWLEEPDGSMSYRIRGLEFARLRAVHGNELPAIEFGLRRRKKISAADLDQVRSLLEEILRFRRYDAADRNHPHFLAQPERWLEAQVRRQIQEIDAQIDPNCLHSQAIGSMQGERGALDLLGIDRDGRLCLFELKATEDIHLPLQAFDYWLRVRHHLENQEFTSSGYFPGQSVANLAPRLFLVSPSLHFHPMTGVVVSYLPLACQIVQVGVGSRWRERVDVVLRI